MNRLPELLLNYIDVVNGRAFPIDQNNKNITELVVYINELNNKNEKQEKEIEKLNKKSEILEENNKLLIQQKSQLYNDLDIAYERIDKAIEYIDNIKERWINESVPERNIYLFETYLNGITELITMKDILKGEDNE